LDRRVRRWAVALGLGCLAALAVETGLYLRILRHPPRPEPGERFDLIAVFGGDPDRIQLGIQEARQGAGQALVVSDSGLDKMDEYFQAFGRPGRARILLEPYARTTDENARLVGRIIRQHGFQRVLLITSWYHQPRSYLLLRLALAGSGVRLRMLSAEPTPQRCYATPEFREELLKFWGSLGRWAKSILRGHGLYPGESPLPVD
jgi:uncharacterized SAM-binding protein YcdF (DUF218 family)